MGPALRKSDGRRVPRFRCLGCRKYFSRATFHPAYRQKKRHLNEKILRLLSAAVSEREIARVLGINRKTVQRKLHYLGTRCAEKEAKRLLKLPIALQVEFDELETIEQSKCKPVSVPLMVEFKSRRILGFQVAQMPAKGKLARISKRKYGCRADHRPHARRKLFERMESVVHPEAIIRSDSNPHYPQEIRSHFPKCQHQTVISRRGAVTGQGELKKQKWDPIFSLNHTCAMFRAHVGRLIRRTWNTTKKLASLEAHLMIYQYTHNERLSAP